MDGYVIAGDPVSIYEAGLQNDTPILIGSNGNEGALFPAPTTVAAYTAQVHARYGASAGALLRAYPASNDAEALQSARDLSRDVVFGWQNWTWARLQSRTGRGRVYYFYFDHSPPYPPGAPFSGAIHGAELAYVFNNLGALPLSWTGTDRELADRISTYWVNFAIQGDPNGEGMPHWPSFSDANRSMMHFDDAPRVGPVANEDKIRIVDGYFARRRAEEAGR
jgi:para-nitrobenzyl esterase